MKKLLAAALVAVVLVAVLAALTDLQWDRVGGTLRALDVPLVAAAFGIYALSFVLRGVRLAVLMPGASTLPHLVSIGARHILLAVVLPFRSGEASLPLMLTLEAGRPLSEGVSVLGVQRVLDLLCVAAALVLGLLLGGAAGATGAVALPPDVLRTRALIALAVLAAGLVLLRPLCARLAPLATSPRKLLAFGGGVAARIAELPARRLVTALLVSLATWTCTYATCWLLLLAMAAPEAVGDAARVGPAEALVGTTGLHLSAVIPVSPLAGAGTWEAGWVAGYALVGMPEAEAMTSALVAHIAVLAFILALGGPAFLLRRRAPERAGASG